MPPDNLDGSEEEIWGVDQKRGKCGMDVNIQALCEKAKCSVLNPKVFQIILNYKSCVIILDLAPNCFCLPLSQDFLQYHELEICVTCCGQCRRDCTHCAHSIAVVPVRLFQ